MVQFRIEMINSEFESREEGEYPSLEAAEKAAIAAALQVSSEAITSGEESSAVEIRIAHDGETVLHRVVSVSVSRLLAND